MIVCVCRAVCDRRLRATIEAGARTCDDVERACGAGGDCGTCRADIETMIERAEEAALVAPGPCPPAPVRVPALQTLR